MGAPTNAVVASEDNATARMKGAGTLSSGPCCNRISPERA